MSEALDANVVLRHFTGQPAEVAKRATNALVNTPPRSLVLADLTVAEIVYVLQGPYARPRNEIARLVEATLSLGSVVVDNEALLRRTLEHYGQRRMDWPDGYLVALVELRHLDGLVSFDRFDAKNADLLVARREPQACVEPRY
ncbi:PIN domain-containing protein [Ferrimicrobium sp.]|nr:PIN domain-containing protein [Ferrimicrobium sp.]